MASKDQLSEDHIEELTKKVGRIKSIGLSLDEDLREDSKIIQKVDKKTGVLLKDLSKTSKAVDTLKRHEWLKLGKLFLFFLFITALVVHYLLRYGAFSFLARVSSSKAPKDHGASLQAHHQSSKVGKEMIEEQPL